MSKKIATGLLALLLSLPLVACDSTGVGEPGTITLLLTDEPGDFTQAIVEIERIELIGEGAPVVLRDDPFTTDLLTLSNDVAAIVDDVTVPAGTYNQLRFVIPQACIGVEQEEKDDQGNYLVAFHASSGFEVPGGEDMPDGIENCEGPDVGDLQLPSFGSSGLKVKLPGESMEVDGEARTILVDFVVAESFGQQAGGSGKWVMHPVIHADYFDFAGSIVVELTASDQGAADLAAIEGASLGSFQVRLGDEATPQPFTNGDGTYTATFLMLRPANYRVFLPELAGDPEFEFTVEPAEADPPVLVTDSEEGSYVEVTVGSSAQVTVAFVVTSAAPPPS